MGEIALLTLGFLAYAAFVALVFILCCIAVNEVDSDKE